MKLTDRNWAALALEGKSHAPEGMVYIGKGAGYGNYLDDIFAKVGKFTEKEGFSLGQTGVFITVDYYTPIETWEETTRLKYSEAVISEKRIKTQILPGLLVLLKSLTENKEFHTTGLDMADSNYAKFTTICASKVEGQCYMNIIYSAMPIDASVQEVSVEEFISFVKSFPNKKPKEIIINDAIAGAVIKITKGGIEAGCQFYDKSKIIELAAQVEKYFEGTTVNFDGNKPILINQNGLYVDGMNISRENFEKVVETFKEI